MLDVILVVDGPRIERSAYLSIAISSTLTSNKYRYVCAVPSDRELTLDWEALGKTVSIEFVELPPLNLRVCDKEYRIFNKVVAMRVAPFKSGVLVDSDTFFMTPPDHGFLLREKTAAAPEHNPLPHSESAKLWDRLYSEFGLEAPEMTIRHGSGLYGTPYFNAGVVASRNLPHFGDIWSDVCLKINSLDLDIKFPYLDQLSLPIAMAIESGDGKVSFENVLPNEFNYNLFHFQEVKQINEKAVIYHHHDRVSIIRGILYRRFEQVVRSHPEVGQFLPNLAEAEFAKYVRLLGPRKG